MSGIDDTPEVHRKRLRRWENAADVRFITFSAFRRLPLLNNPRIMDLIVQRLAAVRAAHGLHLYAWVVMPEHVHLLVRPAGSPWDAVARSLKTQVARNVLGRWRERSAPILGKIVVKGRARFWQHGGGFDRNVRDVDEFAKAVRYIHRNPVERGLVVEPTAWKWSSARWWRGERSGEIACDPPPGRPGSWVGWKGFE